VYSARTPAGGSWSFGTSGLLYRSNKLMYDRSSHTLWSNLTGEPVVGRLALSPIRLPMRPVVVTRWRDWRRRHPGTTVLKLPDGYGARWGFRYRPGAADRARAGVEFPIWLKDRSLERSAEVFGLRVGDAAKAYPVDAVSDRRVVNDALAGQTVVLIADAASGAVRAYARAARSFVAGADADALIDERGGTWRVTERALVPASPEDGPALPRLPGHLSFWFAWYGFFPRTELYRP
jgi:hypothetical protein